MMVLHILYAGLGGHANVFASMVMADKQKQYCFAALYNGVEPMRESYVDFCTANKIPFYYVAKKKGLDIAFYFRLFKAIKKVKPNVLFLHGGGAILPAKVYKFFFNNGTTIVVRETQANHLKLRNDWINLKLAMLFADKMVYLSEEYKLEIEKKLPMLYKPKKSFVIPNGIDLTFFNVGKEKKEDGVVTIGMAARMTSIKDHATLIKAFADLVKKFDFAIELLLAGEGANRMVLEALAAQLNVKEKVVFVGLLNETQLATFLNGLDVYVHATFGETMSTAIMQAMACGLPIIASDVPGVNNMIQHNENGLLVKVAAIDDLVVAIETLVKNRELQNKLSIAARAKAEMCFGNKKMFEEYRKIF
jgi:L-malate glycosyltransferase